MPRFYDRVDAEHKDRIAATSAEGVPTRIFLTRKYLLRTIRNFRIGAVLKPASRVETKRPDAVLEHDAGPRTELSNSELDP